MLCQLLAAAGLPLLEAKQLMGDVETGQNRDALKPATAVVLAQFAQFAVEIGGRADQAVALLGFAADQVIPIEDLYGLRFTHVWFCSSDFSRLIISSTRVRACS